jgi:hypothetical protein
MVPSPARRKQTEMFENKKAKRISETKAIKQEKDR